MNKVRSRKKLHLSNVCPSILKYLGCGMSPKIKKNALW
jgi:bisphosphoglycerate-independent phosphoglycerate mutase (AlkP superfamily)